LYLNNIQTQSEAVKITESKKIVKLLRKMATKKVNKNVELSRHRFFTHRIDYHTLTFNVLINNVSLAHTAHLINSYIDMDKSGKIRNLFNLIHLFVKKHKIDDVASG
jgi:hypothetical protein